MEITEGHKLIYDVDQQFSNDLDLQKIQFGVRKVLLLDPHEEKLLVHPNGATLDYIEGQEQHSF